jgi:biopolymer transport protein ExbB
MPVPASLAATTGKPGFDEMWRFFADGGFFMLLLLACSLVAVAVIFFKLLSLRRAAVIPVELARRVDGIGEVMKHAQGEAVFREFEQGRSTLARLCAVVARSRGNSRTEITEAVQAAAREEIVHLHAGMTTLDVVITVAPLLGLLGTASGLAVIFSGQGGIQDYEILRLGIGRALSTTIVGLAIAVPAIIAQGWFQRRIDTMAARLEVLLTRMTHAFEQVPATPATPPAAPTA